MKETRNINLNINDGDTFFAHEMAINFNPLQFIFDFKSITPRIDNRSQDGSAVFSMKHNVVMVDPWHAKEIMDALVDSVKKYEKEFGKLEKPKALQKYESDSKKKKEESKSSKTSPNYLG